MLSRIETALIVGIAFLLMVSLPALAARGGNGGGDLTTTISLAGASARTASASSGEATFDVTRSEPYDKDTIYVVNRCWDGDGNLVVSVGYQVLWGMWDSLNGTTGAMPTGGTHCTAYVSIKNKQ